MQEMFPAKILPNIVMGCILMVVTMAIHTGFMLWVLRVIKMERRGWRGRLGQSHLYKVGLVVICMFMASVVEVAAWAVTFLALGVVKGIEEALYFSMVTFTTLGYGDIVIHEKWRLLASFEAANGIIMFGWTTALVMAAVQHVYFGAGGRLHPQPGPSPAPGRESKRDQSG